MENQNSLELEKAKNLYDVYAIGVNNQNFIGDTMPPFEKLGDIQKKGWLAVLRYVQRNLSF